MLRSRMQESVVAWAVLGVLLQLRSLPCGENCTEGLPLLLTLDSSIVTKQ